MEPMKTFISSVGAMSFSVLLAIALAQNVVATKIAGGIALAAIAMSVVLCLHKPTASDMGAAVVGSLVSAGILSLLLRGVL